MTTWEGDIVAPHRGRVPLLVASGIPVVTMVIAWDGMHQLPATPVFIPVWLILVIAFDLMTVALLGGQYRSGGSPRVLALTWAYLWSAVLSVASLVSLSGSMATAGPISTNPQVSAWLMCARLLGVPALVVVSLVPWTEGFDAWMRTPARRGRRALATQLAVAAAALVYIWVIVAGGLPLPRLARAVGGTIVLLDDVKLTLLIVNVALLAVGVLGVRARRRVQGLEAWALVALMASCAAIALTLRSGGMYDVAWYGARAVGLAATLMVMGGLLRDMSHLQAQVRRYARTLEDQNHELTEAQAMRDHLVAVVSHEMRNPLAGLGGYLEVLEENEGIAPEETRRMLARSRLLTRRLTLLTEDLLASASEKDLTVFPKPIDMRGQLDECVAGFPDLDVIVRCPGDLEVLADSLRLQQVLANLLRNAQKYGLEPVRLSAVRFGGSARISVSDAGTGVPEAFVPRLFERYARADESAGRGSGLGLALSRVLIERHGGTLDYDAAENAFVALLPAVPRPQPQVGFSLARSAVLSR